jgi:hypothetical protein
VTTERLSIREKEASDMPRTLALAPALLVLFLLSPLAPAARAQVDSLANCKELAFSTEEDFVTQGPEPADGNPVISDGDLLGRNHAVCLRNSELMRQFDVETDMGLDAVDVLDVEKRLVAFSTELDSPHGNFAHGDLLTIQGAAIPNQSLLYSFGLESLSGADLGLDAVHFVGELDAIQGLLSEAAQSGRAAYFRDPDLLLGQLRQWQVDIWFSVEGTFLMERLRILDGDLLSARDGNVVAPNSNLLPSAVPAGIPSRGIDYGLDGITTAREPDVKYIRFTTEILFAGERSAFDDGDLILYGNGVETDSEDLYESFEPRADFLGTDALYLFVQRDQEPRPWYSFLPRLIKGLLEELP